MCRDRRNACAAKVIPHHFIDIAIVSASMLSHSYNPVSSQKINS